MQRKDYLQETTKTKATDVLHGNYLVEKILKHLFLLWLTPFLPPGNHDIGYFMPSK